MTRSKRIVGLALACALGVAACGDDDDDDGGQAPGGSAAPATSGQTPGTSEAPAPSTTDSGGGGTSVAPADGEPIAIGVVGPFESPVFYFPELRDGVIAAAETINANGGIDGRPIEVKACDDELQAPKATECFRQFADDESVVALVGGASAFTPANSDLLEGAGLPWFGPAAGTTYEFNGDLFVMPSGIGVTEFASTGSVARDLGAERATLVIYDVPGRQEREALIQQQLGTGVLSTVLMDPTTVDVSPVVNQVMETDRDAVILVVIEPQMQALTASLRQFGYADPVILPATAIHAEFLSALGDAAGALYITSPFAPIIGEGGDRSATEAIVAAAEEHTPNTNIGEFLTNSWLATQVFAEAARRAGDEITRESVLAAAKTITDFEFGAVSEPIDLSGASGGKLGYENLSIITYAVLAAQGGSWIWDGELRDLES